MKKLMVLWIVIVIAILAAGCATLGLSPEERELAREFDKISLTADDVKFIKACGFNPDSLTPSQKATVMKEGRNLSAALMYYQ